MEKVLREIRYILRVFELKAHVWAVYRLKLIVWIISGIIEPIVWSVLWYVTSQQAEDLAMTGAQILSYYLFVALMSRISRSWTFDTIRKEIRLGRYTKYLLWPKGVIGFRIGADWSNRIVTVIVLLPIWVVWLVLLMNKGLFVVESSRFLLFIIALLLGIVVRFLLDMVLAHLTLFFEKMDGVAQVYWAAFRLFGGVTVPLLLLPSWAFDAIKLLPFRYMVSFPIEIFQGLADSSGIIQGFTLCLMWISVEIIILYILFKYGLRKYEAAGI